MGGMVGSQRRIGHCPLSLAIHWVRVRLGPVHLVLQRREQRVRDFGAAAYKKYCTKSMRDYVVPVHHADIEKFRKLKPAETEAQKAAASSKCYMECLCAALAPACHNTAPGSRYALPMPTDHGCIERERERATSTDAR